MPSSAVPIVDAPQTSVLNAFQVELLSSLQPYLEESSFAAEEVIFARGSQSDAFYIVDEGAVRIEAHSDEVDTDSVLDHAPAGSFLGQASMLSGSPHSLTAIAETPVKARRVATADLKRLFKEDPETGIDVLRALARETSLKLEHANAQLAENLADGARDPEVDGMVAAAVAAQREFESWPEQRVDKLLEAIAQAFVDRAAELAERTVAETTIGNVADKTLKIQFASMGVCQAMAGKVGHGVISEDVERKVTELASPVGVIVGLVPVTNPVPTFANKTVIALKSRNAIILSCHRMAQALGDSCGELVQEVLAQHGAPTELVQWIRNRTSRRKTAKFMGHEDVGMILATGGPAMVKAAYSSGKPAIGVGAGNAPAWIAPDADLAQAAEMVVASKTFDNGLVCGSEQHLVVDASVREAFVAALGAAGAVVLDDAQTECFISEAFEPSGDLKMQFVGRTAGIIAAAVGIEGSDDARLLVFQADASNPSGAQAQERLAPVLSLFTVEGDDAAIELCRKLLEYHGAGHTANIHTSDPERVRRFADAMPASRTLVNAPSAMGCCGVVTGLPPSLTLGCGTFGGNSTTDNVSFENLRNVKRIAHVLEG